MGMTLKKVLTTYRAQPMIVDHPAVPKAGEAVRIGRNVGVAAINELETTSFQTQHKMLVNKPYDPINLESYADGVTPCYMQQNQYWSPIRNVSDAVVQDGAIVYYYDDPTDAEAANSIGLVVGASAKSDAVAGILRVAIPANTTDQDAYFDTTVETISDADLTPS